MRSYLKTLVIGGLVSLPFLGFGAGSVVMGVDATVHRWAALGGGTRGHLFGSHSSRSTTSYDRTRLYGPGLVLAGMSLCLGSLLVIPSALIRDHGKGRQYWPKVVLLWKVVRAGATVGFGMAILASIINILARS